MDQCNNLIKKKVLLLSANPKDSQHLRLSEEFKKIKHTLTSAACRGDFDIIQGEAITVDDLRNYLLTNQPNIVHFSGHSSNEGIYVENALGQTHRLPIRALAELFGFFQDKIECVILNACYAEKQAQAINHYIPYVIGTNEAIKDQDAIHFAMGFYDALFTGYTIKKAFNIGRNNVEMNSTKFDAERGSHLPPHDTSNEEDDVPPIILLENKALLNAMHIVGDEQTRKQSTASSKSKLSELSDYYYDFFISYANADASWVHGFLQANLEHAGKRCLTANDFRLGHSESLEIERAIQQSERILLVLTPEYLNNPAHINKIVDALERYRGTEIRDWPVIPILLREVNLPPRLDFLVGLDFSNEDTRLTYLQRLTETATIPFDDPDTKLAPPYPGLRAFREDEADLFYGRNQTINKLITQLRSDPFLTIIGASGSGKSSLIYAGLIPALQKTSLLGSNKWCIKSMRPNDDAIKTIECFLPQPIEEQNEAIKHLLQDHSAHHLLLFVDQFEEIFSQPEKFIRQFCQLLEQLDQLDNVYVILTLRAGFFHRVMTLSLWPLIDRNHYNLLPLNKRDLERVIGEPAKKAGVFLDGLLVERMIHDAANEPGILPFIQETMNLLWDKLEYHYLPVDAYDKLQLHSADGELVAVGLKAAIALHAEASFKGLGDEEQTIAQHIFMRLVQFGTGRANVRRQQAVTALDIGDHHDRNKCFDKTLQYLASDKHRLLILSRDNDNNSQVDIAHESLLDAWPRLKNWIIRFKNNEKMRRHFLYRANEWLALDKKGAFLDKLELEKAMQWMNDNNSSYIDEKIVMYIKYSQKKLYHKAIKNISIPLFLVILIVFGYAIKDKVLNVYLKSQVIKESELVYMKPEKITLGRNTPDVDYFPPWETEPWSEYWIERYEVTNAHYCKCIKAKICKDTLDSSICDSERKKDLPVINLNLKAAMNYCHWLDRRIPHEAEWEFVARQTDPITAVAKKNELYRFNVNLVNKDKVKSIYSSNTYDKTDSGVYGLIGNVSEWTLSSKASYPVPRTDKNWYATNMTNIPYTAVVRGASIKHRTIKYVSSIRQEVRSDGEYSDIGFRCVSDSIKN